MRFLLAVLAVCASAVVAAQTDTAVPSPVVTLSRPEVPPGFPGGDPALKEFIETNLVHPQDCAMGKVWVEFTVETDGNLHDIKIVRGINAKLDAEALRLVRSFPAWIPGSVLGTPTRMVVRQAIPFGEH